MKSFTYKLYYILILFSPRFALVGFPGISNSEFRLDSLLQLSTVIFIRYKLHLVLIITLLFSSIIHIINGNSVIREFGSFCFILSCYGSYIFGYKISKEDLLFLSKFLLIINILLHSIGSYFENLYPEIFLLKYGIFHMPFMYTFSLLCWLCYIISNIQRTSSLFLYISFACFGLVIGENRNSFLILIIMLCNLFFFNSKNIFYLLLTIFFLLLSIYIIDLFGNGRSLDIFKIINYNIIDNLLKDDSFSMRVNNLIRFIDYYNWLDIEKKITYILFGGGALSFLEYSIQFNKPGHFDVLYLRILSEYGIFGFFFFLFILFKISKLNINLFIIILVSSFTSEAIFAMKTSFIFFSLYGFFNKNSIEVNNDK